VRVRVIAVGRLKEAHWRSAADEYLKRLGVYARVEVTEVADRDLGSDERRALAAEGDDMLRALPASTRVVALDLSGAQRSSEEFASWLDALAGSGASDVTFLLGGAAGLAPDVLARADETLALGRMTLPHQMARVVLLEQLYRAFRIIRGEPYHR
jgi:23S rRNA (pseudouridine1915-N3)-methyltransferase